MLNTRSQGLKFRHIVLILKPSKALPVRLLSLDASGRKASFPMSPKLGDQRDNMVYGVISPGSYPTSRPAFGSYTFSGDL